jgi:thiosulfate reductase cytochrome b subunit
MAIESASPSVAQERMGPTTHLTHAANALLLLILAGSGLEISMAHAALYLGDASEPQNALLTLPDWPQWSRLGGWLAGGRHWHLAAAWAFAVNGLIYLTHLVGRRPRAILPEVSVLRALGTSLRDHIPWRPKGSPAPPSRNPLQKLTYAVVVLLVGPGLVLTGLALSPSWDALLPWWTLMFGGRQTARTLHFGLTILIVLFTVVHALMVAGAASRTWRDSRDAS